MAFSRRDQTSRRRGREIRAEQAEEQIQAQEQRSVTEFLRTGDTLSTERATFAPAEVRNPATHTINFLGTGRQTTVAETREVFQRRSEEILRRKAQPGRAAFMAPRS